MLKEANEQHKRKSVRGSTLETPEKGGRSPRFNTMYLLYLSFIIHEELQSKLLKNERKDI